METDTQTVDESHVPAWIRIPLGIFVAVTIIPMAAAVTLPFLLFGPLAAPFVFMAFLGDWAEERHEWKEMHLEIPKVERVRRYSVRPLPLRLAA